MLRNLASARRSLTFVFVQETFWPNRFYRASDHVHKYALWVWTDKKFLRLSSPKLAVDTQNTSYNCAGDE